MRLVSLEGALDGVANMARDEALLGLVHDRGVVSRLYAWDGPWVSLGRFQKAERALKHGCPAQWVTRPTGGKAVLHGHDVTVGLCVRLDLLGCDSRSLKSVYRSVVAPLLGALNECGIPAVMGEKVHWGQREVRTADCFAHVAPHDLVDERTGRKVCGCALRLTHDAVLVQASIPNRRPLVDPHEVFEAAHPVSWSEGLSHEAYAEALERQLERLLTGTAPPVV